MGGLFPIVKIGVGLVVGSGAQKIISDTVAHTAQIQTVSQLWRVRAGSVVLGAIVGDFAGKYAATQLETVHDFFTKKNDDEPEEPK